MSYLLPGRRRRPARWPYEINRNHGIATALQGLIVSDSGAPLDLVRRAPITRNGTVNIRPTIGGSLGFETTDAATGTVGYPVPTTWNNGLTWTFLLQKTGAAYSGSPWIADSSPVLHLRTAATTYQLGYDFRTSTHTGAKDVDDGAMHIWTSVVREPLAAGASYELYIDGVHQSTNNPGLQGSLDCSSTLYLGNSAAGTRACGWTIAYWMAHDRDLPVARILELHEQPWSWTEEYARRTYFLAVSASGTTYERSFTLTGDGTVTVGAQAEFQSSITITGDGTYGGPAQWTGIKSATFTGDGVATFGTQAVFGAAVTVTGNAVVDFTGTTGTEFERSITLTGDGTAAFATQVDWSPQADFAGAGTVTVAGTGVFGATTTISGVASLAFTAGGTTNNAVGFTASGTVGFTEDVGGVTAVSFTLTAGLGLIVVGQIVGSSPDGVWLVASPESDVWTKESPGAGWLD